MAAICRMRNPLVVLALGFLLAGCASSGPQTHSAHRAGRVHYTVAPYQINGVWYYPKVDYDYDATGTASWYGPGFDRRPTADGETYDMNDLTAAHKTLPLPSVVVVTNLQNGREVRLRVNDRGPFVGTRLIDVSRRAAQLLGFENLGTAPVRVRVLKAESIAVAEAAMRGEGGSVMVAAAAPPVSRVRLAAASPPPPPQQRVLLAPPAPLPPPPPQMAAAPPALSPPPPAPPQMPAIPPPPAEMRLAAVSEPPPPARSRPHYWPSLIASAHAETLHPAPAFAGRSSRIFVQAGAFAVAENAQRVRARIAGLGSAEIVRATVNGTAMYRVRLGPVASEAAARRLLTRVVDSGYPGARLVDD